MRLTFLGAATIWLFISPARVQENRQPPISPPEARKIFQETRLASMSGAGRLWGKSLDGPLLVVDPGTRFAVANRADPEGRLSENDGVFTGTLPGETGIANTAVDWAGVRWTMLIWPLPEDRYDRARLLMHESFHRIQPELGLPGANPANSHLDSEAGRTWLRLEFRALSEALIRRGEQRRKAVEAALIFRARRRALFPQAAAQERALELNEGTAEYTGFKLCGWPEEILADRAAVNLERRENSDRLVRSFAYSTGPAYGILLDEAGADWRTQLNQNSDLGDLLAQQLEIPLPEDLAAASARRASDFDGSRVMADEAARAQQRQQTLALLKSRFVDGPVLVLPLGERLSYTFDPRAAEALDDRSTFYSSTRIVDVWGILEADRGALLSRNESGHVAQARVPAPPQPSGAKIEGDGWTLTLNEGWRIVAGARPGDYRVARESPE